MNVGRTVFAQAMEHGSPTGIPSCGYPVRRRSQSPPLSHAGINGWFSPSRNSPGARVCAFYGRSENAVKTQLWAAVGVYVLVAMPLREALSGSTCTATDAAIRNQLSIFNL
jgi:hypothetical protein